MEVVAATPGVGGVPPYHDHDVREWSRINSLTGVLERARLETDQWSANTNNSCHKYGKVVDSRARTNADGALQQKARRQLEVYQSQIPGGHLQVIKSHTVSSSRWSSSNNKSTTTTANNSPQDFTKDFENLELSLNSLDLSSQKSKANVGRSVGRRPPSRPRARDESSTTNPLRNAQQTAATNLYRVSRLCHQIHDDTVKQTFGKYFSPTKSSTQHTNHHHNHQNGNGIEIHEIESVTSSSTERNENSTSITNEPHPELLRTKSTSSEDLHLLTPEKDKSNRSTEDLEDLEQLQSWRRSSKVRRSLQYPKNNSKQPPKPLDLPESNGSVRKIREELEKGRRLSTALRGNNVDLEALDQILQSISSSSSVQSESLTLEDTQDLLDKDQALSKKQKRNSFVTVESLQEVRGRLRHTNSSTAVLSKSNKEEEPDDGIVTEDCKNETPSREESSPKSYVRSYVYGMESMLNNKKPILGTGSLESRSKILNGNIGNRHEDWHNRRKSYGFEQVHNHNRTSNSISLKIKGRIESSTDSGICKSSEIMVAPNMNSQTHQFTSSNKKFNSFDNEDPKTYNSVKKISSIFDQTRKENSQKDLTVSRDNKHANYPKQTTITIPIVSKPSSFVELPWDSKPDQEIKRHSIAVDESKYVTNHNDNKFRRTSLAVNEKLSNDMFDDSSSQNRKLKKVEFCKTEVHFAAESGKVNIVETDEKPPPTHNFRRRRRNSGPLSDFNDFDRGDLPVLHFGDSSFEHSLLALKNDENHPEEDHNHKNENIYENLPSKAVTCGPVTVNTSNYDANVKDDDKRDFSDNDNIKGILKNKPVKPTPYHLGENEVNSLFNLGSDKDNNKWGVKLKPINKSDPPYWKSTVTLSNTVFEHDNENYDNDNQREFQVLLKNLKPTNPMKPDLLNDQDSTTPVFVTSSDSRRSWSVADKVKLNDFQWADNKIYSTKINFGDGGRATVESDSLKRKQQDSIWARRKSPVKDAVADSSYIYGVKDFKYVKSDSQESNPIKMKNKESQSSLLATSYKNNSSSLKKIDLKTATIGEMLSSPSLVGKNSKLDLLMDNTDLVKEDIKKKEFGNISDTELHRKFAHKDIVLRQPKKSEMTYFGVNVTSKSQQQKLEPVILSETNLTEKPDLLQHMKIDNDCKLKAKPKKNLPNKHPAPNRNSPIYENLINDKSKMKDKYSSSREFDSTILSELTKAADQILKAVNDFAEEEENANKISSEKSVPLDTISESKFWSQDKKFKKVIKPSNVNHNSSTSSLDSVAKDVEKVSTSERKPSVSKYQEKVKKKPTNSNDFSIKNNTKARRLQRANSREALLQSRGSSSEDLGTNVVTPQRKPRQIKKTKSIQLTVTQGVEINKKSSSIPNPPLRKVKDNPKPSIREKTKEALPEIRHKTAISTIKSTTEKSSRDHNKNRISELKRKVTQDKKESYNKSLSSRTDPGKDAIVRDTVNHRISTANIKKCHRSEKSTKQ